MRTFHTNIIGISLVFLLGLISCREEMNSSKNENGSSSLTSLNGERPWRAEWITAKNQTDSVNAWTVFRKEFELKELPSNSLMARIAVDSKYWLWINGKMVVREGGLKRGPSPEDTYYDEVAIGAHLKVGDNSIAVLLQYFGKHGFSHNSSGTAGFLFDLQSEDVTILSDGSWKAWPHASFGETQGPHPNYRLPESNILFDANKGDFEFATPNFDTYGFPSAVENGVPPVAPWNKLTKRIIPQWKDFGLRAYVNERVYPFISDGKTISMELPYNAQVNPYLKIESATGNDTIDIRTDHYNGGGAPNIRGIYVSKPGVQEFELPGWINGHNVLYSIPKGVKVLGLQFRETGYDTEFAGSFVCDDLFYNQLWQKSLRTLYVTMRDTYMDCPDRERAQWWGDEVLESGEAFYALDRKSDALVKKGMKELMNWQRRDSTIFSPIPTGNWDKELPGQMLASVGYYGFYNYYLHTGDIQTIKEVYEPVKKYLSVWKLRSDGTLELRQGGWTWGDWGENKDIALLLNTQYHLAQKGLLKMAEALGKTEEAENIRYRMDTFKKAFNTNFWNGNHYRSPEYDEKVDDRSQALAVVSGLADPDKFPALLDVFKKEMHASPYMEKYVVEALFQMGYPEFAMERLKQRFSTMVNHPSITTLWEGWGIGKEGFGGGTINHAWSGGGLTLLSQYVAGIAPITPGYQTFEVQPQLGPLKNVQALVPSIKGDILVSIEKSDKYEMDITVPSNTEASVYIQTAYGTVEMNQEGIIKNKEVIADNVEVKQGYYILKIGEGNHSITAF